MSNGKWSLSDTGGKCCWGAADMIPIFFVFAELGKILDTVRRGLNGDYRTGIPALLLLGEQCLHIGGVLHQTDHTRAISGIFD